MSWLNETSNETEFLDYLNPPAGPIEITVESIKLLMAIFGTVVEILIIYIILRYKNMKNPVNIYIMNWLICGVLLIIVDPSENRLFELIQESRIQKELICVMVTGIVVVATVDILFMLILMMYWFTDKPKTALLDRHCFKIVGAVWCFGLTEIIITSMPCLFKQMYAQLGEIFLGFIAVVFIIAFTIIHCTRRCSNPFSTNNPLPVALITSFMICWITMIMIGLLYEIFYYWIFLIFLHCAKMVVYLYPLIVFYLFYKFDRKFAACARILFKKQRPEDVDNCTAEADERE